MSSYSGAVMRKELWWDLLPSDARTAEMGLTRVVAGCAAIETRTTDVGGRFVPMMLCTATTPSLWVWVGWAAGSCP